MAMSDNDFFCGSRTWCRSAASFPNEKFDTKKAKEAYVKSQEINVRVGKDRGEKGAFMGHFSSEYVMIYRGDGFGKYLDEIEQFRVPDDDTRVAPSRMYLVLRALYDQSRLYRKSGGVHTSIFVERDGSSPRLVAEDIGRHNTLDKLQGMALLEDIPTRGGLIMASGRISSEMLFKAAIMGVPIVGSRTSPTNLALAVAERLNITVCGYVRQGSMNVYTHPQRIAL